MIHHQEHLPLKPNPLEWFDDPGADHGPIKAAACYACIHAHPTVALFIKNLRREGDAVGRLFLLWDILPHPHAVLFIAGDVQLCVVHLQSVQE